jgi:hypothetical protein
VRWLSELIAAEQTSTDSPGAKTTQPVDSGGTSRSGRI